MKFSGFGHTLVRIVGPRCLPVGAQITTVRPLSHWRA
jgi:hypothetical protein